MTPTLTLDRIAEIEALFAAQKAADIAATWAERGSDEIADEALLDAADAAANAINDQVDAAEVVMICNLARQKLEGQPKGWKLVPVEPTPDMIGCAIMSGLRAARSGHDAETQVVEVYRAMVAAAPTPPAASAGDASDTERLDWLQESENVEITNQGGWGEDPAWRAHRVNGGRNDREWTLIGDGDTIREAIDRARATLAADAGREGM